MRRSRANLPNRCCRQIDRIAYRAFDGKQWMDREGRAATTRNTYCGNLLWQSSLTLLAHTDPKHHDEMIAFTSQLCHLISSAYVREPLAKDHVGYSAGSFRDMARVGAPDPDTWTELFFSNRDALLPILERYINRLDDFRGALAANDRARLHAALEDGVAAKAQFGKGLK